MQRRGTRLSAPEEAVEETLELVAPLERTAFGEAGSPGQTSAPSAQKPGSGAWPALNSSKVCRTSSMFSLDRPTSIPDTPADSRSGPDLANGGLRHSPGEGSTQLGPHGDPPLML